jgi:hypothetical protein
VIKLPEKNAKLFRKWCARQRNTKAMGLRMTWLWNEWSDDARPWVGLGNPCNTQDKELFAASTEISIRNGKKALFWEAPWLDGRR